MPVRVYVPEPIASEVLEIRELCFRLLAVEVLPHENQQKRGFASDLEFLRIQVEVLDRDTAKPIALNFDFRGTRSSLRDPSFIRRALLDRFSHELDELMLINGERVHDPHQEKRHRFKI